MIPVQGAAWQVVRYRLGDQAYLLVGADIGASVHHYGGRT